MEHVINHYETYNEERRLTTNNARKIEFIITTKIFDELIPKNSKILDCGAGCGIYSFYLKDQGHDVVSTDITPKHIEYIEKELKNKPYNMATYILDARDLSKFKDETFDVVLLMGPLYHLIDSNDRNKCISESLRVLKNNGLIMISYINKFYILSSLISNKYKFASKDLMDKILSSGTISHKDNDCFWTDAYFEIPENMEKTLKDFNIRIVDHIATDGISPLICDKIDNLDDNEFNLWCDYQYSTCREKSILGISNHSLIIGTK